MFLYSANNADYISIPVPHGDEHDHDHENIFVVRNKKSAAITAGSFMFLIIFIICAGLMWLLWGLFDRFWVDIYRDFLYNALNDRLMEVAQIDTNGKSVLAPQLTIYIDDALKLRGNPQGTKTLVLEQINQLINIIFLIGWGTSVVILVICIGVILSLPCCKSTRIKIYNLFLPLVSKTSDCMSSCRNTCCVNTCCGGSCCVCCGNGGAGTGLSGAALAGLIAGPLLIAAGIALLVMGSLLPPPLGDTLKAVGAALVVAGVAAAILGILAALASGLFSNCCNKGLDLDGMTKNPSSESKQTKTQSKPIKAEEA